jgi:hypothetical protein
MTTLFRQQYKRRSSKGFILPLTLLVCTIILTIATGISVILAKELYFSKLGRLSQLAYYAADDGLMCAVMIDDQYLDPDTGLGIFPSDTLVTPEAVLEKVNVERQQRNLPDLELADIKCATSAIFDPAITNFATSDFERVVGGDVETGRTSTFDMTMDLGDGTFRCATVVVNKTPNYRQVISRGFAACNQDGDQPIERAVINTTESSS